MKITREKTKSARIIILIFGILSAVISAFTFFAASDSLNYHEGRANPVLTACFGILFFLISVMINKTGRPLSDWRRAVLITLTVSAVTEAVMFPFLREAIHPILIGVFSLTLLAAVVIFLLKRDPGNKIPLILGIMSAGSGILLLNTQAYVLFNREAPGMIWLGFFFAALFMALAISLTGKAFSPEQRSKAVLVSFGTAAAVQIIALIYAVYDFNPASLYIFQGCLLAALISVCIVFYLRSRGPRTNSRGKKIK